MTSKHDAARSRRYEAIVAAAAACSPRPTTSNSTTTCSGGCSARSTIRLAKMNLAVHGLDGDIEKAITYYEDPHELAGKADYPRPATSSFRG